MFIDNRVIKIDNSVIKTDDKYYPEHFQKNEYINNKNNKKKCNKIIILLKN